VPSPLQLCLWKDYFVAYQAEYIWLDGTEPTAQLRSKTRILEDNVTTPPIWGFDGSSTNQATGDKSDCVLNLVLNEVLLAANMRPHPTNTRAAAAAAAKRYAEDDMWFGMEQEYTMLKTDGSPLGFPDGGGFPAPQGPYYCGVGADKIYGREIVEDHTQACIDAGLKISGTNAEVMPGQWEFQIGPAGVTEVGDHIHVARWLLQRIAEDYDVVISFAAKPQKGDWNGAGMHTNFSS
jgi:glutamine synthetase